MKALATIARLGCTSKAQRRHEDRTRRRNRQTVQLTALVGFECSCDAKQLWRETRDLPLELVALLAAESLQRGGDKLSADTRAMLEETLAQANERMVRE